MIKPAYRVSPVALVVKNLPASAGDIKRHGFDPWVGKIPWRRAWQPTPVFSPGESPWTEEPGGLQSMGSQKELDTTEATERASKQEVCERGHRTSLAGSLIG